MNFKYLTEIVQQEDMEIENPFNCTIEAFDIRGYKYYLIINTSLGATRILEVGPVGEGVTEGVTSYSSKFSYMEFNESKIINIINKFLNNNYRNIIQAQEVEYETIKDNIMDPKLCIEKFLGGK